MRRIDFISGSPQLSIFKEGAYKTNLGGTLFLIEIIVLILLVVIYFVDYFSNDKYQFNYTLVKNGDFNKDLCRDEEMKSQLKNLDYRFFLGKDNSYLSDDSNFIIIDHNLLQEKINNENRDEDGFIVLNSSNISDEDECIIQQGEMQRKNPECLSLAVLYRCNGTDCDIRDDDKIKEYSYYLSVWYRGFNLNHQSTEKPLKPLEENHFWIQSIQFLENTNIVYFDWKLIKYEEEKGIFGKTLDKILGNKNIYYGGDYTSRQTFTDDGHIKDLPEKNWKIKDLNGNHFKLLLFLFSRVNCRDYEKYTRKKISWLDILANVAALGSTVLNLMSLAYGFLYSKNFDNYKILENILTKKMRININDKSQEVNEKEKIELKTDLIENQLEEIEQINIDENIKDENTKKKESYENLDLPLPKFFDFLFHKLYFKCFGLSSKQALIDSCNDIVAKYVTIENILYNQLKLEYLWKDYKWNNPQYEIRQKDDLILDLKEQ